MKYFTKEEQGITFITVQNDAHLEVTLCTLGASFYSLKYLGKNRIMTPKNHEDFYKNEQYYGKLVGRFSGRIQDAKCTILEKEYLLPKNWNGINSLHGGDKGISFSNFSYYVMERFDSLDVVFDFMEEENYLPGDVTYRIIYHISKNQDKIALDMHATTTKTTIVNLTNHVYFTLSDGATTVLENELQLQCSKFSDLDNNLIAKKILPVTPMMDFRSSRPIGQYIQEDYLQKHTSFGYDHFFVKENEKNPHIARLSDPKEGISLSIETSYPAVVVYTDNYPTNMEFTNGRKEQKYQAIALECQYIPNGIHMKHVNPALLYPKEDYNEYIIYSFDSIK